METKIPIWKTKEFEKAKEKFIQGGRLKNKCEWCGSDECLTPHHTISYRNLWSRFYREVTIKTMSREIGFTFTPSALYSSGGFFIKREGKKGYIKVGELGAFMKEHPELKLRAEELAKIEYFLFNNVQTLCKKCHFATHKGLYLCDYCKKKYYSPDRYGDILACSDCNEKALIEFNKELDELEAEDY